MKGPCLKRPVEMITHAEMSIEGSVVHTKGSADSTGPAQMGALPLTESVALMQTPLATATALTRAGGPGGVSTSTAFAVSRDCQWRKDEAE